MSDTENNGEQRELSIKEEYQLWRKNYYTTEDGIINTKLLLGTHTSGNDQNYLKVAETHLSADGEQKVNSRIKIVQKFTNNQEICRARYMPQDPNIVGSINGSGEVDLYRLDSGESGSYSHFSPHSENGYGLSWNPIDKGVLLTAADDRLVCVSDTNKDNELLFKSDTSGDIVNDAKWHHFNGNIFASVSEDQYTYIYDTRAKTVASKYYSKGSSGINSLTFSPFSQNLLAIGNSNASINLLDLRKLNSKGTSGLLHTLMGHTEGITCMEFSPHKDGILASGGSDRRLILWDLFKVGEEQQQEDAEDGCPELFMIHAGHTAGVTDLSWCPFKEWTIGSVADDNIVHLWEVNKGLLVNEDTNEDIPNSLLE